MKTTELLEKLANILADDQDIKTFCQAQFGRAQTVYLGVNPESPPEQDEYPVIILFYAERTKGESNALIQFLIEVGIAVYNEEIRTDANKKIFSGLEQVEDLRELVETAILDSHLGKIDVNGETHVEVYFPLFGSHTAITIAIPRSSRYSAGRN